MCSANALRHTVLLAGLLAVLMFVIFFFAEDHAMADDLNGYMDLLYSRTEGRSGEKGGVARETSSEAVRQQYNLMLSKQLFPSLSLLAGGTVEKSRSTMDMETTEHASVSTAYRPFFDLALRSPFVTAGAGYSRQQTTAGASGGPMSTRIQDRYYSSAGWKQEKLPSLLLRWDRNDIYDRARVSADQTNRSLTFTTRYDPLASLSLRYDRGHYDARDNLLGMETRTQTGSGRADYNDSWFAGRLALYGSYAQARRTTELLSSVSGALDVQVFAFSGLYAVDDTPIGGALDPAIGLIDGDLGGSTGITLGLPVTVPGARNLGMDLGSATAASVLAVWVTWNNSALPVAIANTFSWDVYTSSDNLNWTLVAVNAPAVFDPFRNRFEVSIPEVAVRYVKLVVDPLTLAEAQTSAEFTAAADQQIQVTELQAFRRATPAGPVVTSTRSASASFRAVLLERPSLAYDLNYSGFRSESLSTSRRTSVSNGLTVSHRFDPVVAGSARASRTDSSDPQGNTTSYSTSAGLTITPLKALSHTIAYAGRYSYEPGLDSVQHSLTLTNTAALYRGVDLAVNGGASHGRDSTGLRADSRNYQAGVTLAPRNDLSLTQTYGAMATELYGSGAAPRTDSIRRGDLSIAYTPLETLYLTAAWGRVTQSGLHRERVQAYGANWSPFRGGALQLSVLYSENHRSVDDSIATLMTSGVRWNISRALYLTASSSRSHTESVLQESRSSTIATELRFLF